MLQGKAEETVLGKSSKVEVGILIVLVALAATLGRFTMTVETLSQDVATLNESIQRVFVVETRVTRVEERSAKNQAALESGRYVRVDDLERFCLKLASKSEGIVCP